jgi:hypothetical protein
MEGRINTLDWLINDERVSPEAGIASLQSTLNDELTGVRQFLASREQEMVGFNADGLPFVAWGILLSGIPQQIASIPVHIGWLFPAVGAVMLGWKAPTGIKVLRRRAEADGDPSP